MKMWILIVATLLCATSASATAQIPDSIIFEGKSYALHTNPLNGYLEKFNVALPHTGVRSSALWRGYVASFEFRRNTLHVTDVKVMDRDGGLVSVFEKVAPKSNRSREGFRADWYSGLMVLPDGDITRYVHMGYGSQYSQYILLEVKRRQLMRSVQLNGESYELFKDMQFQAYKQTPDYKSQRDSMLKEGESQAFIDSFLRDFVIDYTAQILEGALNFRDSETGQPAPASIRQHEVEVPQSELEKSGLKFESMPHRDTSVSGCQTNEPMLPLMAFLLLGCCALARVGKSR